MVTLQLLQRENPPRILLPSLQYKDRLFLDLIENGSTDQVKSFLASNTSIDVNCENYQVKQ